MVRFKIPKGNGWLWAQHSMDPGFCRSQAERAREGAHTHAMCYSAAHEKCRWRQFRLVSERGFQAIKTTSGVHWSLKQYHK